MPPERSRQLVFELDAWYRSHTVRQKDLANELGLTPQQLSEILALRNRPTGEQALRIAEFLEKENMSTETPKPTINRSPDMPKTLDAARIRIEALNSEIAQLRSGAPTTSNVSIVLPATSKLPPSSVGTAVAIQTNTGKAPDITFPKPGAPLPIAGGERPKKIVMGADLDSPEKINAYIATLSTADLRACLRTSFKSELERMQGALVYQALKNRENITGGSVTPDP